MSRNPELDRLKIAQDTAFQRKQDAYQVQQRAWERRSSAREVMNRAYDVKQRAWEAQDAAWQELSRIRNTHGPRIEWLKGQQEAAYQNMKQAFENASSAYARHDGASASSYSAEGRRYQAESKGHVEERRRLIAEIGFARDRHTATQPPFQRAKAEYVTAKRTFDEAKAAHERAQADFKLARERFDTASAAFRAQLDKLKADKRSIAERAGVPAQYLDNVRISKDSDGNTNIYFGGIGEPTGPGHGHYVVDGSGRVTYRREPFDPHGAENFTENRRVSATLSMAQTAMNQWARSQTTSWTTQHEDSEFKVQVKSGYSNQHGAIVTDVLIHDKQNRREHYHLIIDEHGRELFAEWRPNRTN